MQFSKEVDSTSDNDPDSLDSLIIIINYIPFNYLLTLMQLPLIEVSKAMREFLLLHSFLSLDGFVAFSILRFGTSAKSLS